VEASGSYSWLVDEMERAGHRPKLANPLEAKRRMALTKKTEQAGCKRAGDPALKRHSAGGVDSTERVARPTRAASAAHLPGETAHASEESHHGTLSRYNVQVPGADLFGVGARLRLGERLPELPMHSREAVEQELATLDFLETQIDSAGKRGMIFRRRTGKRGYSARACILQTGSNPWHRC
jgi:hypothetical protein